MKKSQLKKFDLDEMKPKSLSSKIKTKVTLVGPISLTVLATVVVGRWRRNHHRNATLHIRQGLSLRPLQSGRLQLGLRSLLGLTVTGAVHEATAVYYRVLDLILDTHARLGSLRLLFALLDALELFAGVYEIDTQKNGHFTQTLCTFEAANYHTKKKRKTKQSDLHTDLVNKNKHFFYFPKCFNQHTKFLNLSFK